jgi:hypothetical protein
VIQAWSLDGQHRRLEGGEPSPALRAGGVLAQARRGAQGRSGHAAGRLPRSVDLCHAQHPSLFRPAVLLRGDADAAEL